jgi:hypothetical protein
MLMMIQYQSGARMEAILLAAGANHMRLMTRSHADTLELNNLDGGWRTDQAEAIEIEAMIPIPGLCAEFPPLTQTAGSQQSRDRKGAW